MANIDKVEINSQSRNFDIIPSNPIEKLRSLTEKLESMQNELVDPMKLEAVTRGQLNSMARNSPRRFRFANDVHCSGAQLSMGSAGEFKTCSYKTSTGATSPKDHKDQTGDWPKTQATRPNGITETVATTKVENTTNAKGMGRVGGYNGWDKTGTIITSALGSFQHNFQAMILGYDEVPEVPVNEEWQLPNLVVNPEVVGIEQSYNATITEPTQLAPPARYSFNFATPTPVINFQMGLQAPNTSTKGYIQFMDGNYNQIAVTDELSVPEGESIMSTTLRGRPTQITNGYINFNPSNAPEGVTVTSVSTFPPSIL